MQDNNLVDVIMHSIWEHLSSSIPIDSKYHDIELFLYRYLRLIKPPYAYYEINKRDIKIYIKMIIGEHNFTIFQ